MGGVIGSVVLGSAFLGRPDKRDLGQNLGHPKRRSYHDSSKPLESPENGPILLFFPHFRGSLESLACPNSLNSLEHGHF